MNNLIWASGSMIIVLILVLFLPLGLTKKGKILTVFAAYVLALIGLFAIPTFPLLKITMMLIVFTFFISYLINNRFGSSLFVKSNSIGKRMIDNNVSLIDYNKIKKNDDDQYHQSQSETASTNELFEEKEDLDPGLFYTHHNMKEEKDIILDELPDDMDDDISYLLNRSIDIEERSNEETFIETEYISDIESLLLEASGEVVNDESGDLSTESEDMDVLPILSFDHIPLSEHEQTETNNPLVELEEIPLLTLQDHDFEKLSELNEKIPVKI